MRYNMHHNPLLPRQCVQCSDAPPTCNCSQGQQCELTVRSCSACPTAQCITPENPSSSGASKGALAGSVAGIGIFLFVVVGGYMWWRRRSRMLKAQAANLEKGAAPSPGPLSPDAANAGTVRSVGVAEKALSPNTESNPFSDPMASRSPRSSHTIPIGLASPDDRLSPNAVSPTGTTFTAPPRPQRSPDLNIRNNSGYFDRPQSTLEPPRPGYAPSQRSGFTVSTMDSTASSAMEALYDTPTIVTAIRAEVVQIGGLHPSPSSPRQLGPPQRRLQPGPSPLAASHFVGGQFPTIEEDPFADRSSLRSQATGASDMTFGMTTPGASDPSFLVANANRVNITTMSSASNMGRGTSFEDLHHPLAAGSLTSQDSHIPPYDMAFPLRRTSQESFVSASSRTDSVLANFPFVPPSPLPASQTRSPLSVVFNNNRQSTASSMTGQENTRFPTFAPHPSMHSAVDPNYSNTSLSPTSPQGTEVPRRNSRTVSTISRASASSSGLDAFQFHFSDGEEPALPPLNPAFFPQNTSHDSMSGPGGAVPSVVADDREPSSALPYVQNAAGHAQQQSRASLDTLALSRDVAANRLPFE